MADQIAWKQLKPKVLIIALLYMALGAAALVFLFSGIMAFHDYTNPRAKAYIGFAGILFIGAGQKILRDNRFTNLNLGVVLSFAAPLALYFCYADMAKTLFFPVAAVAYLGLYAFLFFAAVRAGTRDEKQYSWLLMFINLLPIWILSQLYA